MSVDPTLGALLAEEVRRHLASLAEDADVDHQRRALHSLKGSAGVAGERSLFDALARIERRHIDGDPTALADARAALSIALDALSVGKPIPAPSWPEPPMDLLGKPVPAAQRALYAAEMADRLARIDVVFADELPETRAVGAIFREIHAMKAAALAAEDEATAWFVHGLEERTRGAERDADRARRALAEVSHWRGLLGELVVAPGRAVEVLRGLARRSHSSSPPPSRGDAPVEPLLAIRGARASGDESMRVPAASLDRLLDRVRSFEQAESTVASAGRELAAMATRARRIRSALATSAARRGEAAAEMAALSDALDREAATLHGVAERARAEATSAHADIALMRTTTVHTLFSRVVAAAAAQARRVGRDVEVGARGGETPIDRRVAEDLFDPILQLVQNAIVHGIEPPETRARLDKPPVGRVLLSAEQRGASLVLVVSDDGAGIDVAAVEARAASRGGLLSLPRAVSDRKALLGLLFVPGFTTKESADMLAGRGVGLALVREAVRRLGGSVRLSSEPGEGLTASIEVPIERGVVRVLWVRAGDATYALPARQVRRVVLAADASSELALPLAACVRGLRAIVTGEVLGSADTPTFVVELDAGREDDPSFFVSVDAVGEMEEAALHAPPPLVAAAGPYNGAIVRGDAVVLCLDVFALGELVHLVHGRRG